MINQEKAFEYQSEKRCISMSPVWIFRRRFDLYAHYAGIPREEVREALIARLNVQGDVQKRTPKVVIKEIPECPLTDVDSRSATYEAFLAKLAII